jgi:predicted nuclease with TOPRIM domain
VDGRIAHSQRATYNTRCDLATIRADYRDLVIEMLADAEAALLEHVASLEADVATYRELTCAAFDALQRLTHQHDRLREQHQRLLDEYRSFRERTLLNAHDTDREAA